MTPKIVTLILSFVAIAGITSPPGIAHAISAARPRLEACAFDQGSAGLSLECKLKLTQIATCWTHPRVVFGLSPEEKKRWLGGRKISVAPFAFFDERHDETADWLAAQRGASIINYLTAVGVPYDALTLHLGDQSVVQSVPGLQSYAHVYGCYEQYYRRSSYSYAKAPDPTDPKSLICPLPGEEIDGSSFGSYTSFGGSLDFEPLVMGMIRSSSPSVPHCSDTPLPVYKHYTPAEAQRLRVLVHTRSWKQQVARGNLSYLQAFVQQAFGEDDLLIAKSLLQAVWSAKPDNSAFLLTKAVEAWSKVAVRHSHDDDWAAANWLQVDLNRQLGNFSVAARFLDHFQTLRPAERQIITDAMITRERRLIEVGISRPYGTTPQFPDP